MSLGMQQNDNLYRNIVGEGDVRFTVYYLIAASPLPPRDFGYRGGTCLVCSIYNSLRRCLLKFTVLVIWSHILVATMGP
jgi:hypothetical protein